MAASNIPINHYFELGRRSVDIHDFEDAFFDSIYENNFDEVNVINMLVGSIYYGNFDSCESILNNYDFSHLITNDDFIDLMKQTLDQLVGLINNSEENEYEALDTLNLVFEVFPFLSDIELDNNQTGWENSDSENINETDDEDSEELAVPNYDSP